MSDARRFLAELERKLSEEEEAGRPIPTATPPVGHRRLCIGMATFDDFDGVWFTVQAIAMYHPEVADDVSFVILDNHPEGEAANDLKGLDERVPSLRYVPFRGYRSTAARDLIFREADADVVCCLDSHVLLQPGALGAILEYFEQNPTSRDMIQGPLLADDQSHVVGTHFEPTWSGGMYGRWATDSRIDEAGAAPFEIPMQGLGLFACRREAWPGLNPRFRGFGGEEGYLHEKVRQRGGRVLCHPDVRWVHRFTRPSGPPYRPTWEDRVRNYRVGWGEIGWDVAPMEAHFRELLGEIPEADPELILSQTARQLASPFTYFDAICTLHTDGDTGHEDETQQRLEYLDIAWRVEALPVTPTPDDRRRASVSGWRDLVAMAQHRGYEHVLGFEGEIPSEGEATGALRAVMDELTGSPWDICLVGGQAVDAEADPCHHALAVHRRAFSRLLSDLPGEAELSAWLREHGSLSAYLHTRMRDGSFRFVRA
jgi:Glycosyl transferase family 2